MISKFRQLHFDIKSEYNMALSDSERIRISQTIEMIPSSWKRLLDVGCGDGRVAKVLIDRGHEVIGIDWSVGALVHYPGKAIVCDITQPWPFKRNEFDGAICTEVLEHLTVTEAKRVISQMKVVVKKGFLITVPADENLELRSVICNVCGKRYHIWGHVQSFKNFEDIDALVGHKSTVRKRILTGRRRGIVLLTRWQRWLGFLPYEKGAVCPYCGAQLARPVPPHVVKRLLNKVLAALQIALSPLFGHPGGWFACRYDLE